MLEIWKDVLGYETHYQVSNMGRVRGKERIAPCKGGTRKVKEKQKKLFINKSGYQITTLSLDSKLATFTVHQLVAMTFLPGFVKGTEINHIDGDKTNNQVTNLEVSNASHNQFHAVRTGLRLKTGSSIYHNVSYINNPRSISKWAACIKHTGKSSFGWKTFKTELEAGQYVDELLDSIGDTDRPRNFRSVS
jgi:stalled ribosome rescue protein Dom34